MAPRLCAVFVAVLAFLVPAAAFAQTGNSGLAGVVRDASGGLLPGVTVEAASPALIEKVRTVVTGADGSYRILDLRPGVYSVTFTLAGFRTSNDYRAEKIGAKVREASLEKVPYMIVVGEKDMAANTVALRDRVDGTETRDLTLDVVIAKLKEEVETKALRGNISS